MCLPHPRRLNCDAVHRDGLSHCVVSDGEGGEFQLGTWELDVIEGTGIYRSIVGGHNHMDDRLHFLAPGDGSGGIEEFCFCFVSGP